MSESETLRTPAVARWHRHPLFRLAWSALGIACAIALAVWATGSRTNHFLLASLGASTIFVFLLTGLPAAQPRSLFLGHLLSAASGIACLQLFGDALWVYALAEVTGIMLMLATRTLHPPAGANPILMMHMGAGWSALLQPVLLGTLCLAVVGIVWSRLVPGLYRWPVALAPRSPPDLFIGSWKD